MHSGLVLTICWVVVMLGCRRIKRARKHGPGSVASDADSSGVDSDTGGSDLDGDDDSDSDSIGNEEVLAPLYVHPAAATLVNVMSRHVP
jgi:hypothetical protein